MTSFLATRFYSPILVALVGVITFVGLLGLGTTLLRLLRIRLPTPWLEVTGVLLGIEVCSLTVQLLGMAGLASRKALASIWVGLPIFGAVATIRWLRNRAVVRKRVPQGSELLFLALTLIALTTNFLVAVAPSTKIDELFYHMLLPSRIVTDGALQFYRQPWEAAILPQMIFQIAMAPLHALNLPDAANVVSWALSVTLVWFALQLIRESKKTAAWVYLWTTALIVGMYGVVSHVTGGSHAMGDLSLAAAVVGLYKHRQLKQELGARSLAAMFSILLLATASSKVSLIPLSAALLLLMGFLLLRSVSQREWWGVALALVVPWTVLALPLMIWTFAKSGSPFGPVLAGVLSTSVYDLELVKRSFTRSRELNRPSVVTITGYALINHTPLFWLGMFWTLLVREVPKFIRLVGVLMLVFQSLVVYFLLPYDLRFLGGLPYGLVVCFALSASVKVQKLFLSRRFLAFTLMLLIPWLGAQIYYARQFFPVSLGLQHKSDFYERYVAYYADYEALDRILPSDAVLVANQRLSAVYSPRQIYIGTSDLPENREVFFFGGCSTANTGQDKIIPGYTIGETVYHNPSALRITYRRPWEPPIVGPLCVSRLIKN
ncbi:MAG: hypothetical protein ACREBG_17065 [Pyrinomonadaceae bacterium]